MKIIINNDNDNNNNVICIINILMCNKYINDVIII